MRLYSVSGVIILIQVSDRDLITHAFKMRMDDGEWRIIDDQHIPKWIFNLEKELSQLIIENHRFLR